MHSSVSEFVQSLLDNLNQNVPSLFQDKLKLRLDEIVLGEVPPHCCSLGGVYKDNKIYLEASEIAYSDPERIAEVFFHELGHALLNPEFPKSNPEDSADLLMYYALEQAKYTESRRETAKSLYLLQKQSLFEMLGSNEKLVEENWNCIFSAKNKWYPILEKSIIGFLGRELPSSLELNPHSSAIIRYFYPSFKDLEEEYLKEDHPERKMNILQIVVAIERTLNKPLASLSGLCTFIPRELRDNIEKCIGVHIAIDYENSCTPNYQSTATLLELLKEKVQIY